jgi:thioredoxin reductase
MKPLSVAVIGGGPSGLFFCHAMEYMMKQTGRKVSVTCFEKASQPGGIWRESETNPTMETTQMYDKLWTNGSSHLTEFFDYTYDEHFGRPVSVYMKRQELLEYILGRVHKNCPDFLEKYVEFRTLVENVVYDDVQQRFDVSVKSLDGSQPTEVRHFDKCVWACGENGRQTIPESLVRLFREGGFKGRIVHSADTSRLEENVKGKRILLVGGGLSAEDLALQAIKLQAEKIYVSTRTKTEICWTKKWPMNKVEVLLNQAPVAVTEDGKCIQFMELHWVPDGYSRDGDHIESEIRNIDTVILCTGYHVNLDMLDESLRRGFPKGKCCDVEYLKVPDDWKMPQNILTEYVGDVPICDKVRYYSCYIHPNFYRGVLISNPNMMFITTYGAHVPLMACDSYAWLQAGYLTGYIPMPSPSEMRALNVKEGLQYLQMPYFRYLMDKNYYEKVSALENFWPEDPNESSPVWDDIEYEEYTQSMKVLARVMQEGKYPFSIGTFEKLSKVGETAMQFGNLSYYHRANLKPVNDEKNWKTFRDYDDADQFYSLLTGTKAVKLEKPWMEIDSNVDFGLKENCHSNGPQSPSDPVGNFNRCMKIDG